LARNPASTIVTTGALGSHQSAAVRPRRGYLGGALIQGLTRESVRVECVKERRVVTGEDYRIASLMLSVMGAPSPNSNDPLSGNASGNASLWPSSAEPTQDEKDLTPERPAVLPAPAAVVRKPSWP
jgi:hypothetical protein